MSDIDISERLLEAILRGDVITPKSLDVTYTVDAYILGFCGWEREED